MKHWKLIVLWLLCFWFVKEDDCFVRLYFTAQIQWSECTITFQSFTYHSCSFSSNIVPFNLDNLYFFLSLLLLLLLLLRSHFKTNVVNALLHFSASPSIIAPESPILFPPIHSSFPLFIHHSLITSLITAQPQICQCAITLQWFA